MIAHSRLLELLTYNPLTGLFIRNTAVGRFKVGSVSGSISTIIGYWEVRVDGKRYLGHRLAWFYMTGEWPPVTIDHENRIRSDNKWSNLRLATKAEQVMNTKLYENNLSGAKGISWDDKNKKWCCEINADGQKHWLGRFDEFDQAKTVLDKKRIELHGQFACAK